MWYSRRCVCVVQPPCVCVCSPARVCVVQPHSRPPSVTSDDDSSRAPRPGGRYHRTHARARQTYTRAALDRFYSATGKSSLCTTHGALSVASAGASAGAKRRTLLDGGCQIEMSSQQGAGEKAEAGGKPLPIHSYAPCARGTEVNARASSAVAKLRSVTLYVYAMSCHADVCAHLIPTGARPPSSGCA